MYFLMYAFLDVCMYVFSTISQSAILQPQVTPHRQFTHAQSQHVVCLLAPRIIKIQIVCVSSVKIEDNLVPGQEDGGG